MQVQRWGKDLALRLPDDLVRDLGIEEGDEIEIRADGCQWRILRGGERRAALEKLDALAVVPPPGFRFARDEAYAPMNDRLLR